MDTTIEKFTNIGNINIEIFKSNSDYCFYLKPSSEDISYLTDIIEDTLKLF